MVKLTRSLSTLLALGLLIPSLAFASTIAQSKSQKKSPWWAKYFSTRSSKEFKSVPTAGLTRSFNKETDLFLAYFTSTEVTPLTSQEKPTLLVVVLPKQKSDFDLVLAELGKSNGDTSTVYQSSFSVSPPGGIVTLPISFPIKKNTDYRWTIRENSTSERPLVIFGYIQRVDAPRSLPKPKTKQIEDLARKGLFYDLLLTLASEEKLWKQDMEALVSNELYGNLSDKEKKQIVNARFTSCCKLSPSSNP